MVPSLDASATRLDRVLDVLVRAGRALTLSPDLRDALAQVAEAVISDFGDCCEIEITSPESLRIVAGQAFNDESGDVIAETLSNGHETFGTITCRSAAVNGFDEVARKALNIVATELGVVIAGQALTRREHRVADRLQRALLPEHLPEIQGGKFYAAYRPASDEAEVGGDWFDAFHLPDRRVAVSVGDVAGHGLEAAVVMGEVRQAIRTAAVDAQSPAAVLDYVNRIIGFREPVEIVTAIFGIYDPVASTLSYATAGHPPPLFALANGLVRRMPSGSLPLGCVESLGSRDWTVTLPAGAQAIFYTDGLVENERDLIAGEKRLIDAVKALALERQASAAIFADPALAVEEKIFAGAPNRDDAAVLVLTREAPVSRYVFSAVDTVSPIARAIVADELDELEIESERRFGVLVAIG
ncbi:MAG TPA: PP2C family protein-serine/threonine phosphatase, partial [Candidatus Cybelea sp.]|nr:PP2C family protein-serine/threonine phosphatase [Candidatus Cybelea sp.]